MTFIELLQNTVPVVPDSVPDKEQEIAMLKSLPFDELMDKLIHSMVTFAINLAIAIVVFYVGKFIIAKLYKFVAGIMIKRKADKSLTSFILSLVRMVLYFILIVTVIGIIGIETSSFIRYLCLGRRRHRYGLERHTSEFCRRCADSAYKAL